MSSVALVTEKWVAVPWPGYANPSQPRYLGSWERHEAHEWGPGWNELAAAVLWGRSCAPFLRVALVRSGRERHALSVGREPIGGAEVLLEESVRVSAEMPWPDQFAPEYGGRVDIHEASAGLDPTGEYAVSVIAAVSDLTHPEDLHESESEVLGDSPFRSLPDAVAAARQECSIVIVALGPFSGVFFSAGHAELPGLEVPRLQDGCASSL